MKVRWLFFSVLVVSLSGCGGKPNPTPIIYVSLETTPGPMMSGQPQLAASAASPVDGDTNAGADNGAFEGDRPVAVRVNNQPIFLETYEKQVVRFEQTLVAQGVDLRSEQGQAALAQVQRQVLETLIDQALIEQAAAKLKLNLTEQAVEAKVQENISQDQGQFEAWLAANSLSYEEFKATLQAQLIANQVFETITQNSAGAADKQQIFSDWLAKQRAAAVIVRYVGL